MAKKIRYGIHQIENTVTGERKTFNSQKEMGEFLKKFPKSLIQFRIGKKDIDNWHYIGMIRLSRSEVKEFCKNI